LEIDKNVHLLPAKGRGGGDGLKGVEVTKQEGKLIQEKSIGMPRTHLSQENGSLKAGRTGSDSGALGTTFFGKKGVL